MTATTHLRSLLPSRADYAQVPRTWRSDLIAGLTVGIVALPLALAFGVTSGAGAEAGIVTAIVAGIVAAIFGGSHVQVSGPTGAMVVVLAPIVATHGVAAVGLVSIAAGLVVLAAGALRLGRAVGAIPWPVIEGFTAGIAIIIFLQQVPGALGVTSTRHGHSALTEAGRSIADASGTTMWWSLGIVAGVALVTLVLLRWAPRAPGSIVAVLAATAVTIAADAPVATIGALPHGLPAPSLPQVSLEAFSSLVGPILTVAALAAIESLLSARVASSQSTTGPYDADRELVGQGLASVAAGFFGGMPATGAIARTAVAIRSGARTRLASVTHAVVLLAVIALGASAVSRIPLAALAGVLMVTALRMVSPRAVRSVVRSSRGTALIFAVTAFVTVSVDLIYAVGIGLVIAALFALRSLAATAGVHREELPGPPVAGDERIALFRIDGALFFGAAERIHDRVTSINGVHVVIVRLSQVQLLDSTGASVLADIVEGLEARGVRVLIKGVQERHAPLLTRVGVLARLEESGHLFTSLYDAVACAREYVATEADQAAKPDARAGKSGGRGPSQMAQDMARVRRQFRSRKTSVQHLEPPPPSSSSVTSTPIGS